MISKPTKWFISVLAIGFSSWASAYTGQFFSLNANFSQKNIQIHDPYPGDGLTPTITFGKSKYSGLIQAKGSNRDNGVAALPTDQFTSLNYSDEYSTTSAIANDHSLTITSEIHPDHLVNPFEWAAVDAHVHHRMHFTFTGPSLLELGVVMDYKNNQHGRSDIPLGYGTLTLEILKTGTDEIIRELSYAVIPPYDSTGLLDVHFPILTADEVNTQEFDVLAKLDLFHQLNAPTSAVPAPATLGLTLIGLATALLTRRPPSSVAIRFGVRG
ncbi:hypothetical protein HNQ59_003058 [Chitinivorax tropicus]|uniref:PEP-CTERM sorting domain-containing protein n=1 Tax=Chitinivorax tropicus TaxID=714531 RepID=A0A840MMW3_9PROT|nr:hypothetical protein [Chitinivorax tropicus]MBB5019750.1 hypothetical protein [Chitinivorax tropicus]